ERDEPAAALNEIGEGRPTGERAVLSVALRRAIDEPRVDPAQPLPGEAEPRHRLRSHVVHHDVAFRRFDLDHLGAEIAEDLGRQRPENDRRQIEHLDPGERPRFSSTHRDFRLLHCPLPRFTPFSPRSEGGKAMPVTMYHNPRCNTSRRTLALLREKGVEPTIIEYLKTPYTAAQLRRLLGQLNIPAKKLVRKKESAAAGIDPEALPEDALIEAMAKNPIIVERPIVVSGQKAALGRPPEAVL